MKMYTLVTIVALATGVGAGQSALARGAGLAGGRQTPADRGAPRGTAANRGPAARGPATRGNLTPDERVDKREANQDKRIEQGIKRGQLTTEEVAKLQGLEKNIGDMEKKFESDGTLTKDEAKQLGKALNEASLQIWAERHDTEGNQKPVIRLGKDVFALDELTAKIESGSVTKAEARKFLADFHKMVNIKHRLATDNLTDEQRAKLQAEYNDLLNKYFTTKAPTTKPKP